MNDTKISDSLALLTSILLLVIILYVFSSAGFPYSGLMHSELIKIDQTQNIGQQMSRFLWDFRGQDLLIQSLLLFATAICCISLLKEERK
ncbi:hypothetical protein FJY84_01175 [Candidatus Bathyarchaeota archaeon]|nr:hypothetical protein [Candidatus Bathyarchaeota archaeon]